MKLEKWLGKFIKFTCSFFLMSLINQQAWAQNQIATCQWGIDEKNIVRVKVTSEVQSWFCLGFIHGQYRSYSMDFYRRSAYGRVAEVLGWTFLKSDLLMRLLDLESRSLKLTQELSPALKEKLSQYAKGVNRAFVKVREKPSTEWNHGGLSDLVDWSVQDTIALMLLQSFDQTRKTFTVEWDEFRAASLWTQSIGRWLESDYLPWETTILKKGEMTLASTSQKFSPPTTSSNRQISDWFQPWFDHREDSQGSNSWVVDRSRSLDRVAMLANDPHLDLRSPPFWFWMHLQNPDYEVMGATLPGIPFVVSGTNGKVSWGLTNSYYNSADLVEWGKKEDTDFQTVRPLVWFKWGWLKLPFFFKSFSRTQSGYPIVPLEHEGLETRALALKWAGFKLEGKDFDFLLHFHQQKKVDDFGTMLQGVGLPSWNFVFADSEGDIGYQLVGKVFKSEAVTRIGFAQEGSQSIESFDFLNPQEIPQLIRPARNWIVTANNRHSPRDAKFYGGRGYTPSFRAKRIEELLADTKWHDEKSFQKIQCDLKAVDAEYFLPFLTSFLPLAERAPLLVWDKITDLDCKACGPYRRFMQRLKTQYFMNEGGLYSLIQERPKSFVEFAKQAWQETKTDLPPGLKWGEIHQAPFKHFNEKFVAAPAVQTAGDDHSVSPGSSHWDSEKKQFIHTAGASQRMIVLMKDTPEIWLSLPGLNVDVQDQFNSPAWQKAWQSWNACEYMKVDWIVDWSKLKIEQIE
jgi:penicillin amidase